MWREPLGRALTRQTDGVNPTILDDPLDAQGGTSCRNCSWTSSPHWTATFVPELSDGSGKRKPSRARCAWTGHRRESLDKETRRSLPADSPFWVRRNVRD